MPGVSKKTRPAFAASLLKHVVAVLAVLVVMGCGGGGCSGCACAGVTPLPNGFRASNRIENAGSVRITDTGFAFLEQNLGTLASKLVGGMGMGGVINFDIPGQPPGSVIGVVDYEICPNGGDKN